MSDKPIKPPDKEPTKASLSYSGLGAIVAVGEAATYLVKKGIEDYSNSKTISEKAQSVAWAVCRGGSRCNRYL